MKSLPEPEGGYAVEELRRFVNVATDGDFTFIAAWPIAALRNNGPYPILAVNGEQGSGGKKAVSEALGCLHERSRLN